MSTIIDLEGTGDYDEDHDPVAALHEHHTDMFYVRIAIALALLTAAETSTYWVDFGPFFLPALLIMMSIKFVMVGIGLAVTVYSAALATFHFFESS